MWFYFLAPSSRSVAYAPTIIVGSGMSAMYVMTFNFITALIGDDKVGTKPADYRWICTSKQVDCRTFAEECTIKLKPYLSGTFSFSGNVGIRLLSDWAYSKVGERSFLRDRPIFLPIHEVNHFQRLRQN